VKKNPRALKSAYVRIYAGLLLRYIAATENSQIDVDAYGVTGLPLLGDHGGDYDKKMTIRLARGMLKSLFNSATAAQKKSMKKIQEEILNNLLDGKRVQQRNRRDSFEGHLRWLIR